MKTILIVDDSPTIRRIVHAAFGEAPITLVEAASGLEAIEQLSASARRADDTRPEHAGHARPRSAEVRATAPDSCPACPVIVLTTRGDEREPPAAPTRRARRSMLTKPFEPRRSERTRARAARWIRRGNPFTPCRILRTAIRSSIAFMDDYFVECDEHLVGSPGASCSRPGDAERGRLTTTALAGDVFRSFHSIKGLSGMVGLRDAELFRTSYGESSCMCVARVRGAGDAPRALAPSRAAPTRWSRSSLRNRPNAMLRIWPTSKPNWWPWLSRRPPGKWRRLMLNPSPRRPRGSGACASSPRRHSLRKESSASMCARLLSDAGDILQAIPHVEADGAIRFEFWSEVSRRTCRVGRPRLTIVSVRRRRRQRRPKAHADPFGPRASHFVRVDLARLDDLMRMIGDLVISRARLGEPSRARAARPAAGMAGGAGEQPGDRTAAARPA